jgi:gamma-glutamyltranspeptidase / glutathione hydrolase
VQVLFNILRGFTAQASLDAPRFCIAAGADGGVAKSANSVVFFEDGIPEETIAKLRGQCIHLPKPITGSSSIAEMGHDARVLSGFDREKMGRGQIIQRIVDKSGRTVWAAGSDGRGDGHAAPQI